MLIFLTTGEGFTIGAATTSGSSSGSNSSSGSGSGSVITSGIATIFSYEIAGFAFSSSELFSDDDEDVVC